MSFAADIDRDLWNQHALLTAKEMREFETLGCAQGGLTFWDLMAVAGKAVADEIIERFKPCSVLVLCGTGNNGGDGYVAAQALRKAGLDVLVAALGPVTTTEAQRALGAWDGETVAFDPSLLSNRGLVVDALFGTGLSRPIEGEAARMIEASMASCLPIISVDMPSGICSDTGRSLGTAVRANLTVTFQRKKRGHVLLPGRQHCGEVVVTDIGLYSEILNQINPAVAENDSQIWHSSQPKCEEQNHKYHRGHLLVYGGPEMTGASRLASRAAQRMGAGLVTLAAPQSAWEVYARALESVMVKPYQSLNEAIGFLDNPKINALLLGPGLGLEKEKRELVLAALASRKPCVLDADALMLFEGESKLLFDSIHEKCVLTPHEGEFARLFRGLVDENASKIEQTMHVVSQIGCVVLQKGADTVVAEPSGLAVVNSNAPPWLATAGAGDVLAGMIAGRITAGMPVFAAAASCVNAHGKLAQRVGKGLIAEDLVAAIPALLQCGL